MRQPTSEAKNRNLLSINTTFIGRAVDLPPAGRDFRLARRVRRQGEGDWRAGFKKHLRPSLKNHMIRHGSIVYIGGGWRVRQALGTPAASENDRVVSAARRQNAVAARTPRRPRSGW